MIHQRNTDLGECSVVRDVTAHAGGKKLSAAPHQAALEFL
jgi:hypothetical protein